MILQGSIRSAIVISISLLGLSIPIAHAATVLEFTPREGRPGERVSGTTQGAGMRGIASGRVEVFLAPSNRAADLARGPGDSRLTQFGVMRADSGDVGRFKGVVPQLAPGSYIAVAYCRECAVGGSIFTVGEFRVAGAPLPATGRSLSLATFLTGILLVLGSMGLFFPRLFRSFSA